LPSSAVSSISTVEDPPPPLLSLPAKLVTPPQPSVFSLLPPVPEDAPLPSIVAPSPVCSAHFPNVDLSKPGHAVSPHLTVLHGKNGTPTQTSVPARSTLLPPSIPVASTSPLPSSHAARSPALSQQPSFGSPALPPGISMQVKRRSPLQ